MKGFSRVSTRAPTEAGSPVFPYPANNREESEYYRAIIAKLNADWRVIECRDAIQWIVQRRAGIRHGEPRWDSRCYCRTRQGLVRRVRELAGECDACALAIIGSLPDLMEGGK